MHEPLHTPARPPITQRRARSSSRRLALSAALRLISFGLLCAPCVALAQEEELGGGAAGTAAVELGAEWEVIVNAADIHGGPSAAYSARGRVFLNERVTVIQVSPNQEWVQVRTAAGAQGWLRSSALRNPRQQVAQDPGRFRRQTDYQYDAQGRRVTSAGAMVGSGEGAGVAAPTTPPPTQQQGAQSPMQAQEAWGARGQEPRAAGAPLLTVSLSPLGAAQTSYRFASDIRFASPLALSDKSALGYQSSLRVRYQPLELLRVGLQVSDARLGKVDIAAHPRRPELAPELQQVGMTQTSGSLRADLGTDLGGVWLGLSLGAHMMSQSFRAIAYAPPYDAYRPLLDRVYFSGAAGITLTAPLGPLSLSASGGALLPFKVKTDYVLGKWTGLGYWVDASLSFPLTDLLAVGLYGQWTYLGLDITTRGQYADPFYADLLGSYAAGYTRASASDSSVGGGASVEMRF